MPHMLITDDTADSQKVKTDAISFAEKKSQATIYIAIILRNYSTLQIHALF